MREVKVRIIAETVVTMDTEDLDSYEELEDYLRGVSLDDATSKQLAVAMVRFDDEEGTIPMDELDWKIIGITPLEDPVAITD